MSAAFRTTRLVEFSDTDMAGIVHFARFFVFMESAEHAFLRACGLSVSMDWEGHKISFPRVSASCDYLKPVRFEDVLQISVQIEKLGRTSITYAFDFHVQRGEELLRIARGQLTAVLCRVGGPGGLESMEIPAAIRAKLEQGPTREKPA